MFNDKQTTLYPVVEFDERTFEIDEFGCASIFVVEGEERALVIDAGMGVGDLRTAVERITDKPVTVVITHGHVDHIQNAWQWGDVHVSERDFGIFFDDVPRRKLDTTMIASRYSWPTFFPYDLERDITAWGAQPNLIALADGEEFDLGGRTVKAFATPGHTIGSMSFLDDKTRTLFVGDGLNNNLGWSRVGPKTTDPNPVTWDEAVGGLRTMKSLVDSGRATGVYNSHNDYRAQGVPLAKETLKDAVTIAEKFAQGIFDLKQVPNTLFPERLMTVSELGDTWISIDSAYAEG